MKLARGRAGRIGISGCRSRWHRSPGIDLQRVSGQRGDGIDDEQHAGRVGGFRDFLQRLVGAGRCFGMDDGDGFGIREFVDGVGDHAFRENVAPRHFEGVDDGSGTAHYVQHALAEDAVDAEDDLVAGFDEVGYDGFHAGHSGCGNGEGEGVFGAIDFAEHGAGGVHDLDVNGVEVADGGSAESAEDTGGNCAGAGAEEDPFGWKNWHDATCSTKQAGANANPGRARAMPRAVRVAG